MKKLLSIGCLVLMPNIGWACACGCGVFDVQTSALFPTTAGGVSFLEVNYMDQNRNWSGAASAPAAANKDKEIRTEYFTAGLQYMFNRDWGVLAEVPVESRSFRTTTDEGDLARYNHTALGDVRLKAIYAGFSEDMSSGLTLGLKLPTGDYTYPNFDCDTQIGTGSTDVLLGGYMQGKLALVRDWNWFATVQLDQAVLQTDTYHPGSELDGVAGVSYNGWRVQQCKIAPVLQAIASHHWRDGGSGADPDNTGYDRLLLAPGVEFDIANVALYFEVALPVYEYVNGQQLVAENLLTLRLSCSF